MTLQEALNMGYSLGDIKYQRGYVSRKVNINNQPVLAAQGTRNNEKYVLVPAWNTTNYCFRQYLIAPERKR